MMQTPRSRLWVSVLLFVCAVAGFAAHAQDYPTRSVKLITQGAAGSGPDVVARIVAEPLGRLWGQQVVILNHPGAAGSVAARQAALAAADGYTLYMPATSVFIVMPEMFPNLPFDLDRDFVRIGFVAEQPMLIAVAPSLGVNSLADLIALAKARPGQILYAANARGTLPHLTAERFAKEAGIALRFVPYAGAAAGLQDLQGGHIAMIVESLGPFLGAIQGGSLNALAVASAQRLPNFPDLPTVGETIPGFIATGWFPLLAPADTPDWIVRKVGEDLRAVLDQPAVRQRLADLGTFARPMSGAETTEFIRREQELWRPVVKQIGVSQ
jgi:tripartite-type tricarboxylate transporter receptor subunit TctC